jgi:hypothetical protein
MGNEINLIENEGNNYYQYEQQTSPQPAFIGLNPESCVLYSDYSGEIGNAVSMDVWNGRELQFEISPYLTESSINQLLYEIEPLAQQVCDGYESEWDGSNHVGTYDEDAEAAINEIERVIRDFDGELFTVIESVDEFTENYSLFEWLNDSKATSFEDLMDYASQDGDYYIDFGEYDIIDYIVEEIEIGHFDDKVLPDWMLENEDISYAWNERNGDEEDY